MADAKALTRVVDELLWTLRRGGFRIATSQAIDAARALRAVGLEEKGAVRDALAAVIVARPNERRRFDVLFDRFFDADAPRRSIWERLADQGFSAMEIAALREALSDLGLEATTALLERGAELDHLLELANARAPLDIDSPLKLGFATYRILDAVGVPRARDRLRVLRAALADALGDARAEALILALTTELDATSGFIRDQVQARIEDRRLATKAEPRTLASAPFSSLTDAEMEEVRRAVRRFSEKLRGGARVRARRELRGRIDPHKTLRRALATGGVPFELSRKRRRRDKPRLVLLCDVSDSVRNVSRFMLELAYVSQELFARTRSFVFVSELGEVTKLFETEPPEVALARAYAGVISTQENSNYGRVLTTFEERHLSEIDRKTTVVILGDGRTNYQDDAAAVLDRIRGRARSLLWLCPESRGEWGAGDSAMARYEPKCDAVLEVRCARDLEVAAREILARR